MSQRIFGIKIGIFLLITVLFVSINLANSLLTEQVHLANGKGSDGQRYYQIADLVRQDQFASIAQVEQPFRYRFLVPAFVGLISESDNILTNFRLINILFNFLTCMMLYFWLRIYLNQNMVILTLLTLYQVHWLFPTAFVWFYPIYTDPAGHFFSVSMLYFSHRFVQKQQLPWLMLLTLFTFASVAVRENCIVSVICYLFCFFGVQGKQWRLVEKLRAVVGLLIPIVVWLIAFYLIRKVYLETSNSVGLIEHILYNFRRFFRFDRWLLSWSLVYGTSLAFFLIYIDVVFNFARRHLQVIAFFTGCVTLSIIGGADLERFHSFSMPAVLVLLGVVAEEILKQPQINRWALGILVALQLLVLRPFMPVGRMSVHCSEKNATVFLTPLAGCYHERERYASHGRVYTNSMKKSHLTLFIFSFFGLAAIRTQNHRRQRQNSPLVTNSI